MNGDKSPTVYFHNRFDRIEAHLVFAHNESCDGLPLDATLTDDSHQAIIEVLEMIWPNWYDGNQWLNSRKVAA